MTTQLSLQQIQSCIIRLPNRPPAMLASDLATIYEAEPRQIAQAIKRNPERFPEPEFCFRLTDEEWANLKPQNAASNQKQVFVGPLAELFPRVEILKSQDATSNGLRSQNVISNRGGERYAPLALTRMGANMLSAVLKTPVAAARSVQIIRAFSALEEAASAATAPVPPAPETVTLTKDEYIGFLKMQIEHLQTVTRPKRLGLSDQDKSRIKVLRAQGLGEAAIGKQIGRSKGTVGSYLRRVRLGQEG